MNDAFEVNTKLALFDYLAMVNEIAVEYIDEDGKYQPQIGELNAMRLFYNFCVTSCKFDDKYDHDITEAKLLEEIVADDEFIQEFNKAIKFDGIIACDFANAYRTALEIVETNKSSIGNIINAVVSIADKLSNDVSPILTKENMNLLSQISKDMSDGKLSAEAIVDAYAHKTS